MRGPSATYTPSSLRAFALFLKFTTRFTCLLAVLFIIIFLLYLLFPDHPSAP